VDRAVDAVAGAAVDRGRLLRGGRGRRERGEGEEHGEAAGVRPAHGVGA